MNATHVRVTNENDFPITEHWDGIPYTLEPGKTRDIPVEAAAVIFGFSSDDNGVVNLGTNGVVAPNYDHMQRRWGWNTVVRRKDEEMAEAVERSMAQARSFCEKIKFASLTMALQEVKAPEPEELAPPKTDAPRNKMGIR